MAEQLENLEHRPAAPISPARRYLKAAQQYPDFHEVQWESAPLLNKLYSSTARLPLSYARPDLNEDRLESTFSSAQFGQMLADIYGNVRLQWTLTAIYNAHFAGTSMRPLDTKRKTFKLDLLRPVPSGGGLFPCELYLLIDNFPASGAANGIYHYDAFHHALDPIRQEEGHLSTLQAAMAEPGHARHAPVTFMFSCSFWKNAFKYGEFSYRLQCLDLGVVIAQSLEVARRYHMHGTINYQFYDDILNGLLALDPLYESVYAVATFSFDHTPVSTLPAPGRQAYQQSDTTGAVLGPAAQGTITPGGSARSLAAWPLLAELHQAALIHEGTGFPGTLPMPPLELPGGVQFKLSRHVDDNPPDLLTGLRKRHSSRQFFMPGALTFSQFSRLLLATNPDHISDIGEPLGFSRSILIYCVVNNVSDLRPGIYCYVPADSTLIAVHEVNMFYEMQKLLPAVAYRSIYHIGAHVFLVGSYEDGLQNYGDRWYRVQNMEAGTMLQRIYLAAAALDLGCDTALAYPVEEMNHLLQLPAGLTTLAQVLLGREWITGQYYDQRL
ncbi:MAG TPA: SagB family peptide dehydrogenase [Ktedonobacteraceae bacterium]|nr:SagB family peptide dehydrogenase [Ktedonobacteraceae bacterium]